MCICYYCQENENNLMSEKIYMSIDTRGNVVTVTVAKTGFPHNLIDSVLCQVGKQPGICSRVRKSNFEQKL